MGRQPSYSPPELTATLAAEALSAWLGEAPAIQQIRVLSVSDSQTAAEIAYREDNQRVTLKIASAPNDLHLGAEFARMQFMSATKFPLPKAHYCDLSGTVIPHSYAIYSWLDGVTLMDADWLSEEGKRDLDGQIGEAVAELHKNHAKRFGTIGEALPTNAPEDEESQEWWRWFQTLTRERIEAARATGLLDAETLQHVERLTEHFKTIFTTRIKPTLIHGNIWSATTIVRPTEEPGMAELSGFLQPLALFAHPELELAHLELWQTVGEDFFKAYRQEHEIEEAYPRRKYLYWVSILIQHTAAYQKEEYAQATKTLVEQVWKALGAK